jgi:hypothetical protein
VGGVSLGSLTSGALGALLATLGAFAVAYFTVRHDRSVVARREELEHTAQDRALRQRVAATARHVVHAFATEQRWSPLLQGQTELALLDLLGSAWADLGATEHSAVAEWISLRYDELAVLPTWRGWGRVLRSGHSRAAYAHELGLVAGQLTAWAAGRVDDSWFTTDLVHRSAL